PQSLTDADDAALLAFVSGGGRLVIGGSGPFFLPPLPDHPPQRRAGGAAAYVEIGPAPAARPVGRAARGSWEHPGPAAAPRPRGGAQPPPRSAGSSIQRAASGARRVRARPRCHARASS